MRKRRNIMATVGVAILLLTAACGDEDGGEAAGELTKIDFLQPLPKSISFYPLFVAEELGYFEDEGVEVNLLPSGDTSVPLAVVTGNADIGAAITPDIIVTLAEGEDLSLVYEHYQKNVFRIVVPGGSDVTSIPDLKGKKIGVTAAASGDAALVQTALFEAGMNPETDIEMVVVGDGGPRVAIALEDGSIDAYAGALSDLVAIQAEGIEFTSISPENLDILPASSLIVTPEKAEELADPIAGFLRAWAKGTYVGMVNQDVVLEIARQEVPEETTDDEFAELFVDQAVQQQTPVGGEDAFGELRPDTWVAIQEQLIAGQLIKEVIEPNTFLDDQFLEAANDWDRAEVEQEVADWAEENL
ncbi:MAG: PhnD/SsuA/transferrin family substrate-binding protein [Actinobacteria bacterium]|nr:PhnD/SsuA/transferrin family substrate-binding protein [Actinomycetota bacterium]